MRGISIAETELKAFIWKPTTPGKYLNAIPGSGIQGGQTFTARCMSCRLEPEQLP